MHETAAAKKIADEIIQKKAHHSTVRIGKMYGNKERFLELVKEFLCGTPLEGATIDAEEVDVVVKCECGFSGKIDVREHVHFVRCPKCGKVAEIIEGNDIELLQ